jgi:regulator of sigma E protease
MALIVSTPFHIMLAIIALGVLIIVHEGGHFLIARLSGMRVDRFSIGFGPKLVSFKRGDTIYQIAAIPLGGFVQIAGLNPGEEGLAADDPRSYPNRPVWQRLATIFAGPGTNYIFAAVLMVFVYLAYGVPVAGKTPLVGAVSAGKPAAAAGLQPGDELLSVDGNKLTDYGQVSQFINASKGNPVKVDVLRDGKPMAFTITPAKDGNDYRIGIQIDAKEEYQPAPAGECIKEGLLFPVAYSRFILHGFREIFAGRQRAEFSGPVGIIKVMQRQIALGLRATLSIIAIISVYLGLFNLLPLPALDGGRLVFLGWEAISRRRVNQRIEQTVHLVGMVVLLCFIVYITFRNDIGSMFHH